MLDVPCSIWNPSLLLLISVAKIDLMASGVGFGPNVTPGFPLHLPFTTLFLLSQSHVRRNHPSAANLSCHNSSLTNGTAAPALSSPGAPPLPPSNGTAMAAFHITWRDPFRLPPVLTGVTWDSAQMGKWRRAVILEHSSCLRQNLVCRHGCEALPAAGSSPIPPAFRFSPLRHSSEWSWW